MTWDEILATAASAGEVEVGLGASDDAIRRAEESLGRIPPDYQLFLSKFGYVSVGPDEIFGLGDDVPSYLNVVEVTLAERRDSPGFPSTGIVISNDGGGNLTYFDNSTLNDGSPVFAWFHDEPGNVEVESPSFVAWLLDKITLTGTG